VFTLIPGPKLLFGSAERKALASLQEETKLLLSLLLLLLLFGYITNSQCDQLPDCLIAQLVGHCSSIAEVMGSNHAIQA